MTPPPKQSTSEVGIPFEPRLKVIHKARYNNLIDIEGLGQNVVYFPLSDLQQATRSQRFFYYFFKKCFLNSIGVDLVHNHNYAFILLYDLLKEYDHHKNLSRLQHQLTIVSKVYPITFFRAKSELAKRVKEKLQVASDVAIPWWRIKR